MPLACLLGLIQNSMVYDTLSREVTDSLFTEDSEREMLSLLFFLVPQLVKGWPTDLAGRVWSPLKAKSSQA